MGRCQTCNKVDNLHDTSVVPHMISYLKETNNLNDGCCTDCIQIFLALERVYTLSAVAVKNNQLARRNGWCRLCCSNSMVENRANETHTVDFFKNFGSLLIVSILDRISLD